MQKTFCHTWDDDDIQTSALNFLVDPDSKIRMRLGQDDGFVLRRALLPCVRDAKWGLSARVATPPAGMLPKIALSNLRKEVGARAVRVFNGRIRWSNVRIKRLGRIISP